ncbi:FHA domain-containing protein [Thiobacter aerophilum]|uniref:FHA domain-containing protein n=1 Tax=Thiobacter aerophilum TaxID=3121275 RepID=A0ABV0EHS9_9BURK
MEPLMVAEVLDKSGRVHSRLRLEQFPVRIGRAYHNDIILDDEFVSPEHARIELDSSGQPVIVDLDSDNGTYVLPKLERIMRHPLSGETLLRLGHTLIRLRSADYQVPPARRDSLGLNRATRWLTQGVGAAIAYGMALSLIILEHHQSSPEALGPEQILLATLSMALAIPLWAGLWALASRSFAHHAYFVPHLAIASAAVAALFVLDTLGQYYAFAFSAGISADVIFEGVTVLVVASALYGHLRFATLLTPRGVGTTALVSALVLVGMIYFSDYVDATDFNDDLPYPGELKPPAFAFGKPKSPARFVEDAKAILRTLDAGQWD